MSAPAGAFEGRHIGSSAAEQRRMLDRIGAADVDSLLRTALPGALHHAHIDGLPPAVDEATMVAELHALADSNTVRTSMIGQGYYDTITPAVIRRQVLENPAWYSAYTPYQAEISQGRLEALLTFQTMIADLTGLAIAGASMLDEATAAAEAMTLSHRHSPAGHTFYVDRDLFVQTRAVLATRAAPLGIRLEEIDPAGSLSPPGHLPDAFGVLLAVPGATGRILDRSRCRAWADAAHEAGALCTAVTDPLALTLIEAPGAWGADIAVGSSQRFGVPMGYGGPHAAYLAVRAGLERRLPGRLVGVSRDADGRGAYRLALQTREQHIRRDRATSNICTSQVLLAVMAAAFAVYHGPDGLHAIAARVHDRARAVAGALSAAGLPARNDTFFDTLTLDVPGRARAVARAALARNLTVWAPTNDEVRLSCDERTTPGIVAEVVAAVLEGAARETDRPGSGRHTRPEPGGIPPDQLRGRDYLTHPVFHEHRSENRLMRYLRRLADADLALDRGMIPLGSCTMKLNSAELMGAMSRPGFADLHPFAPAADARGYRRLIDDLETWLAALAGYDGTSVQPNAGSQGELAGLLAIRRYHAEHAGGREPRRDVCIVPASAHGTNAASAVLAGFRVAVVATGPDGGIDRGDLHRVLTEHAGRIAAIMITYPSTHGVYEPEIVAVTRAVHEAGGQVYLDGANFNALVGVTTLAACGGDVSHLNLHKTFCIPHGGGGPGVGPVVAAAHLVPHLPGHPCAPAVRGAAGRADGAVAAAPDGSPSILPISWAYLRLMGVDGLRRATGAAVLAANYLAEELAEDYPVLYRGPGGRVAHECVLDLRDLTRRSGITVEDVAKRLIDYGFHAPTMSFPVPGTLMVEPTESEDLAELDRFVAAMRGIRSEIDRVEQGRWPREDNPLVNAPHPARMLTGPWPHPYSRDVAVYPGGEPAAKYWPPVRRIDGAHGDRNLVCACPPVSESAVVRSPSPPVE
ncbi:aminomethyl-transferring glycine dehydrogenase [Pseudactinotalea sp. HY160]|uniref:aminomethyl-transferring glycine dehydrogenase n=1 Tax=Pseudactinotalea sp. HY160 TaxID=2654490 RepID=UPI0013101680|nr:aminomethyl-transferring glycine dehydrogenase [Pseudactinotalea sp. HY160]